MFLVAHGQDRARGLPDDLFRNTAQQHVCDRAAAVSAEDDQVDVVLLRVTDDLDERVSFDRCVCDIQFFTPGSFRDLAQAIGCVLRHFCLALGREVGSFAVCDGDEFDGMQQVQFRSELVRQFAAVADGVGAVLTEVGWDENAFELNHPGLPVLKVG